MVLMKGQSTTKTGCALKVEVFIICSNILKQTIPIDYFKNEPIQ